jgi:uncharacterized DUF497 family protein
MGKRFRINQIIYSDGTEEKLVKKHRIRIREVYQVLDDEEVKQIPDRSKDYGFRLVLYGRTYGGRCLIVWLFPQDIRRGVWSLATAREASENEKKRFFEH